MKTPTNLKVLGIALGIGLNGAIVMAQPSIFITNSFTNELPTDSTWCYAPGANGLQAMVNAEYGYAGNQWGAYSGGLQQSTYHINGGSSFYIDPNMVFPGNSNGTGAMIFSNGVDASGIECDWLVSLHMWWPTDFNAAVPLTNISDLGFWIYFTNTSVLDATGDLGRIGFFLTDQNFGYQGNGNNTEVTIPATALGNWAWISINSNATQTPMSANITAMETYCNGLNEGFNGCGFWFEYDNWGQFVANAMPFTNVFWIANPTVIFATVAPPVVQPTLSIAPAYPGLTMFTASGNTPGGTRQNLHSSAEYSWVSATNPVSYSFTVNDWPVPLGDTVTANIYLVQGLIGANPSGADYEQANVIQVSLSAQAAGGVTWGLSYKTNAPLSYMPAAFASIAGTAGVGTWTVTFNSPTNVTLSGPKGTTATNFNLPDPYGATALLFTNDVDLLFGVTPGNVGGCNDNVSFSDFKVTGLPSAFDDNFVTDSGNLNTSIWSTLNTPTPSCIQMVVPGSPCWIKWTQPAFGFSLYVTPSLEPGSPMDTVTANLPFIASTNYIQLLSGNDVYEPGEDTVEYFMLRNP